jgi:hypothetical protein
VGIGLALATLMGASIRVADALMRRLAVPLTGDLPESGLARRPASPAGPAPQPRNLAFADGLDGWQVGGGFLGGPTLAHWEDYTAAAGVATLRSAVPDPFGEVFPGQAVTVGDYRGATVTFGCEVSAEDVADHR